MEDDMFIDVKSRLDEFTDVLYVDYERESILLEIRKDYLDEIIKILKNNWLAMDIIFQKEIQSDVLTILACVPQIIDVYDE
jgi:hypothetical protein